MHICQESIVGISKFCKQPKNKRKWMKIQTQREIYESVTKYQYLSVTNLYQFGKFIYEEKKKHLEDSNHKSKNSMHLSNNYISNPKILEKNQMYVTFQLKFTLHTVMHVYM